MVSAARRLLLVVIIAAIVWALSRGVVDWGQVAATAVGLEATDWLLLIGVSAARFAVEPLLLMAVTRNLSWARGLGAYLAPAAAASIVPGPSDMAARYAMYRSWSYSGAETSAAVMLIFVFTTAAKVVLPVIAAVVLLAFGRSTEEQVTVAVVALGVLLAAGFVMAVLLRSEATARRIGSGVGAAARRVAGWFRITAPNTLAADLADHAAHFREQTGDVIRSRWQVATPAALLAQAGMFATLVASVRVVGITSEQLDWVAIFSAFAFVQLLTSVPITPSGLGVAEAAYLTLLAAESTGGLVDEITAAALLYRLFSWVIVIPLGGVAWVAWSRTSAGQVHPTAAD